MEGKSLQRIRRSEAEWRDIVERQSESGMSVGRFCKAEGLSDGCFYRWRRLFSRGVGAGFLELSPDTLSRDRVRAELDLGQGMVFRIFQ